MPLINRPIRLTSAHVRTAVARTVRSLDAWTLVTFNPAPAVRGRRPDSTDAA